MSRGNAAKRVSNSSDGPWTKWRGSLAGKYIRFIQSYLRSPKGENHGKLVRLAPFQKERMEEALAVGIDSAVTAMPAGNGKSTWAAGLANAALFVGDGTGAPQVPVIATTLGQAIRSVYGVAESMVRAEPELASRANIFTGVSTPRIVVPSNGGVMFPISQDIDGLQGLDPSFAVVDELGFLSSEVWSSMLARAGKRSRSLLWGTGTPGLDRNNALFALREKWEGGLLPPGMTFVEYAAEPGCALDDREQWRIANPALAAGFMREDALLSAMGGMPEAHFRVFRLGQWVDGIAGWLGTDGRAVWRKGLDLDFEMEEGAPTWVGIDVGLKRDSSVVCWVQLREDGRFHADFRVWLPTADEPVDVLDIMGYLRRLAGLYDLRELSYDPRFFDVSAKLLTDEGLRMVEVPQSLERMTPAVGDLYALLMEGRVTHGADPQVEQQVLNAIPRLNERGFTLSKGKSRGRIDAAVALALAVDRATHKAPKRAPLVVL